MSAGAADGSPCSISSASSTERHIEYLRVGIELLDSKIRWLEDRLDALEQELESKTRVLEERLDNLEQLESKRRALEERFDDLEREHQHNSRRLGWLESWQRWLNSAFWSGRYN